MILLDLFQDHKTCFSGLTIGIKACFIFVQNPFGSSGCGLRSLYLNKNPFGLSGCGLSSVYWEHYSTLSELLTWQIRVVEPFYQTVWLGTLFKTV